MYMPVIKAGLSLVISSINSCSIAPAGIGISFVIGINGNENYGFTVIGNLQPLLLGVKTNVPVVIGVPEPWSSTVPKPCVSKLPVPENEKPLMTSVVIKYVPGTITFTSIFTLFSEESVTPALYIPDLEILVHEFGAP